MTHLLTHLMIIFKWNKSSPYIFHVKKLIIITVTYNMCVHISYLLYSDAEMNYNYYYIIFECRAQNIQVVNSLSTLIIIYTCFARGKICVKVFPKTHAIIQLLNKWKSAVPVTNQSTFGDFYQNALHLWKFHYPEYNYYDI